MRTKHLLVLILTFYAFSVPAQMILEFNTNLDDGTDIALPLYGTVDVIVDWGDGSTEPYSSQGLKSHTYASEGIYTVSINGTLSHFGYSGYDDLEKLTKIVDFGDIGLTDLSYCCHHAINLIEIPNQIPGTVTDLSHMFENAYNFDVDISDWDVSNITTMNSMFYHAQHFNMPIGDWDVSNVTDMQYMFYHSYLFNQHINDWDVSNVTDMNNMFMKAQTFNEKIDNWDVSNVTDMSFMFRNAFEFNQNIGSWDVSNVNNMQSMFFQAYIFNQNIGSWDVSNVTNMQGVFYHAHDFDQNLGNWNVSNVTDMGDILNFAILSVENYDALLNCWADQTLNPNLNFHGGYSQYSCAAIDAHDILTSATNNWTVSDGGLAEDITNPTITCPSNFTVIADDITQTYTVQGTELDPLAYDYNCEGSFIVNDYNSSNSLNNTIFNLGTTCVLWTVEDNNGNINTCSFDVTIETYTDIPNEEGKFEFSIYPNPVN
ncbi:MAG: hypothetical protein C0596_17530 [Marinilabiliales bacterium]|nr:MAG: hypothetical protein C0596_17530 [Marinilabiliales bacterium]